MLGGKSGGHVTAFASTDDKIGFHPVVPSALADTALHACVTPEQNIIYAIAVGLNSAFDFIREVAWPVLATIYEEFLQFDRGRPTGRGQELKASSTAIPVGDNIFIARGEDERWLEDFTLCNKILGETAHMQFLRGKELRYCGSLIFELTMPIVCRIYDQRCQWQLSIGHTFSPSENEHGCSIRSIEIGRADV
jgi:hypothetical protein